jgi:hypothetical protein
MRYRAQPWVPVAALAAVCGIALWGLIAYRNRGDWTSAEMARSLPLENAVIAYADIATLRSSGLFQTIFGTKSVEELDYRKFVTESGFDYKTDLDRVAISFQKNSRYAIAVGRFDWPKIKSYALQSGAECINAVCEVRGKPLENSTSFYPLRGSAMALASTPQAGGVYTIAAAPAPANVNDPWPEVQTPFWVLVPGTVLRDPSALPTGVKIFGSALASAQRALFTVEADANGKAFRLRMQVSCNNEQDAGKIVQQLTEATNLLRNMMERDKLAPKPSDLAGLLVGGKFTLENPTKVSGVWPLQPALIQAIAEGNVE